MILYSFTLMEYATYLRFKNWLATHFQIEPEMVSYQIGLDECPVTGMLYIPEEKHEAFLEQWYKDSSPFRMDIKRMNY